MIYFDNAATTIDKPKAVADAVYNALISKEYANPSRGVYPKSLNALKEVNGVRIKVAEFFGAENPLNVVLTPNITYALNFLISGLFDENDHIISDVSEHNSVLRPLYQLQRSGAEISFLGIDENFEIKIDELKNNLKKNTKAVIITAASNVSGRITNLKKVNEFTLANDLILIVDGAQIAGTIPFSLKNFDNIIFAFTGHKSLHGPMGTGGFIAKGDFNFKQVFSGGSGFDSFSEFQPKNLPELYEPGTFNLHSFMGLKAAIQEIEKENINKIHEKLEILTKKLYLGLKENKNLKLYTKLKDQNAPIVSFNIADLPSGEVARILWDEYEIATRSGSHCAPKFHESVGTKKQGIVRMSLSSYNTEEEIEKAIRAVFEISKC